MRIISINTYYQDGLGYQDYYLGKEWHRAGHEVHFISSDYHFNFPDYDNTVKHIIGDRYVGPGTFINEYGVPVHRLKQLFRFFGWVWLHGFIKKIDSLEPDLIVMHGVFNFQSIRLSFLSRKYKNKIIFDDHTTVNLVRDGYVSNIFYFLFRKLFSKLLYNSSIKIIGISKSCISVLNDKYGLSGSKIQMIPLGSDTDLFYPDTAKRLKYRKQLGISASTILITYTGKMYDAKKIHVLLQVVNHIEPYRSNIVVLLVGSVSADYQFLLDESIKQSLVPVILKKSVSQELLPFIYNASDIAIWPAHTTTSTLDASACGCPIICSNYMPERYENHNGIGIVDGNSGDLKSALEMLLENSTLRIEMGKNGTSLIKNKYSWKAISNKFIELINE